MKQIAKRIGIVLGWVLFAIFFALMFIWRWNHEMVRVYDMPPIRVPFGGK